MNVKFMLNLKTVIYIQRHTLNLHFYAIYSKFYMSDNIIDRIFLPFLTNDGTRFTKRYYLRKD